MDARIQTRYSYGVRMYTPKCGVSTALARIAGTKTLTPTALLNAMDMGIRFFASSELEPHRYVEVTRDFITRKEVSHHD